MDIPAPGDLGSARGRGEDPFAHNMVDEQRHGTADLREPVAERSGRLNAGQLLAHAGTTGQPHDAGLACGVPRTRLLLYLLDRRDWAVPAPEKLWKRCRQRAVEGFLGGDGYDSGFVDDEQLCHWRNAFQPLRASRGAARPVISGRSKKL